MLRASLCLLSLLSFVLGAQAQVPRARRLLTIPQSGAPHSLAGSFSVCSDFDGDGAPDVIMPGSFKWEGATDSAQLSPASMILTVISVLKS